MISEPMVTVYITNHNYDRFIRKAIDSVLNQTLQDFELIIIDDGSTDSSKNIIEEYSGHKQIKIVFQQNKGLNVTNNIALRMASGKYIMRLDADDFLDEHALAILSGALERNPKVGLVFPDYFNMNEDGEILDLVRRHDFKDVTLQDQPAHGACTMIRRQCLLDIDGYDESFRCQDGYDLWLRFIGAYEVQNVNLPLFFYRQHSKNLTKDDQRILETRAKILTKNAARKIQKLSCIGIIPIRGRVTDPHSIALRKFAGKPLIDWSIEAAIESKRLSKILVTSPDEELLEYIGQRFKDRVVPVKRDLRMARPNTFIEDTLFHSLKFFDENLSKELPDVLAVLYSESPFRTGIQIDNAIDTMELFDTDTVVSVRPDLDIFYQHNGGGLQPLRKDRLLRLEREELFKEAGQIYLIKRKFLQNSGKVSGGKVGHVVVDQKASLRLRTEMDWQIGEFLAEENHRGHAK